MQKKLAIWSSLLVGCLVMSGVSAAQPGEGGRRDGGGPGRGGPPRPIQRALDTDQDGTLSPEEISAAPTSLLALDRYGDGALTANELQPPQQAEGGGPEGESVPSPDALVQQLMSFDKNHDGVLTADEVSARLQNLFARADTNHDGKLSAAELRTLAQKQAPPAAPAEHDGFRDPLLVALDPNRDDSLSAAEIAVASTSLLTLDANHDGQLTGDEMRPRQPAPSEQAAHLIAESDKNGDGKLSRSDAPDFLQAQFERIDKDANGLIDRDELAAFLASNNFGQRGPGDGEQRRPQASPDSATPQPR